ncbi:hypothetical protein KJ682_14945 [bacterium]|nr:hypothetical protein [bacterium]
MKHTLSLAWVLPLCLMMVGGDLLAQDTEAPVPDEEGAAPAPTGPTKYEDFSVKAYSLEFYGGSFSGGKYLENKLIGERTIITDGGAPIFAFNPDGSGIPKPNSLTGEGYGVHDDGSLVYDTNFYRAAHKEIKSGDAFGARIGVYIADHFHLDLLASYQSGKAVTTMLYDPDTFANTTEDAVRIEVDSDDGFKVYKGGLALMYDAEPATFFGIEPRIGFGLGGIINRYTYLEDKTGLYLEGNFGLVRSISRNLSLAVQADVSTFAFDVDELGYSNMVSYTNFTVGLNYFIDVLPPAVRAGHEAAKAR